MLYGTVALLSILMIAELPMFGFKFKSYGWKGNEVKYLFIILSVVLLAALKFAAVSLIIILYVIVSLIQKYQQQTNYKHSSSRCGNRVGNIRVA